MDVTFREDRPFFPVIHLQGETVREESNCPLEYTSPTLVTLFDPNFHPMVLHTNQVPWITYYKRNLRKEIESPIDQPTPVQDSEVPRDQGMTNPIDSSVDSKMSENDRLAVSKDMRVKDSVDEIEVRV